MAMKKRRLRILTPTVAGGTTAVAGTSLTRRIDSCRNVALVHSSTSIAMTGSLPRTPSRQGVALRPPNPACRHVSRKAVVAVEGRGGIGSVGRDEVNRWWCRHVDDVLNNGR
jgi:hypothetical protein